MSIEDRQAEVLDAFMKETFPTKAAPTSAPVEGQGNDLADEVLLGKAREAVNGEKFATLYDRGDWRKAGFASCSEADLALVSSLLWWTNGDVARVDRLFRASKLMRDKWERADYRERTLGAARIGFTEGYASRRPGTFTADEVTAETAAPRDPGASEPPSQEYGSTWAIRDVADIATWNDPPVEYIVENLTPARGVLWDAGKPKGSKSLFNLYEELSIAADRETVAGQFRILKRPNILYLSLEDPGARIALRVADILAGWGMTPADLKPGRLSFLVKPRGLDLADPRFLPWIIEQCRRLGVTFLVIDTWTRGTPGADPMSAEDQTALGRVVVALEGALRGTVRVIDHTRKNTAEGMLLTSADIFGPNQKWQIAEHVRMFDNPEGESKTYLYVESKDADPQRYVFDRSPAPTRNGGSMSFRTGIDKFAYLGTTERTAQSSRETGQSNRQRVLDNVVGGAGASGVMTSDIATALGLGESTVRSHLSALAKAGRVRREGSGAATRWFGVTK